MESLRKVFSQTNIIGGFDVTYDEAGNLVRMDAYGDMNCDGAVTTDDIAAFTLAMTDSAGYATTFPNCLIELGDFNGDGAVTAGDIAHFVAAVTAGGAAARSFAYDEENRLLTVHEGNDLLLEMAYDALGRRVVTVDHDEVEDPCDEPTAPPYQEVQTRHVYLGLTPIEEHRRAFCDVNPDVPWGLAREYLWGENFPEPVALIDWTEAGDVQAGDEEWLFYLRDVLGSVVGLVTPEDQQTSGTQSKLVERYAYDPYGRTYIEVWSATLPSGQDCDPPSDCGCVAATGGGYWCRVDQSEFGNPFMWTGQRYDASVGLYHFLFRSYSPELGRWMQRDPSEYEDGISLYEYVRSYALIAVDPLGLVLRVGGTDAERRRIEHLLNKICPGAKVDKNGYVSVPKPDTPTSCSSSAPANPLGPPSGCGLLDDLIKSPNLFVINFAGGVPGKHDPKPGGRGGNIDLHGGWLTPFHKKGGGLGWAEPWEVLLHELVHAHRNETGRTNDNKALDEEETINETIDHLDDHNKSNPDDERPLRDPKSHGDPLPEKPKRLPPDYYPG